ncbi:MAG TPA: ACT domain-containing protein [Polyangiaceae bacterium]|jgi:glycine cleavage system transcriptional repressor|nr:ACT domain-containing protein [Polyangiaceae bacterium]
MSEKQYRVLSAVGVDRPGLVERVSGLIHVSGANLEDSRMAILGGEFALILLLSGSEKAISEIEAKAESVAKELGLEMRLRPTQARTRASDYLPYRLRVSGVDRPGIVAQVSALLAQRKVNVAALDSRLSYAPLSGTPWFQLQAKLQVPSDLGLASLRSALTQLCDEENLDFVLEGDEGQV